MTEPSNLIADLHRIRVAALEAVDPAVAIHHALRLDAKRSILNVGSAVWDLSEVERVVLIAAGKAAIAMAKAACEVLNGLPIVGMVVTRHGQSANESFPATIQVFESGHPVPDLAGVAAAEAIEHLLSTTSTADHVLVLLSGGASALLPLPVSAIALTDLQHITSLLLRSGASIDEVNTIRKHLDRLKGGQLARLAHPSPLAALILSDVVGDPLAVIASGPTVPDPSTYQDCWHILQKYGLADQLPLRVETYLQARLNDRAHETPKPGDPVFPSVTNTIVGSNRMAAEAAIAEASRAGYRTLLLSTFIEGEAQAAGKFAAALAKSIRFHGLPLTPPACIVWGGETTVVVRGGGKGGRNQEVALSAAIAVAGLENVAILALATDGIDGPTNAAGAIITGHTIAEAIHNGFDPQTALAQNDSYPLLKSVKALLITGATGTNVNDLLVILVQ